MDNSELKNSTTPEEREKIDKVIERARQKQQKGIGEINPIPSNSNKDSKYKMWRCHTPNLLKQIFEISADIKDAEILQKPIIIFKDLLVKVGERASELDDPKLNALMCRLAIYEIADPESKDYNPKLVNKILRKVGD